MHAFDSAQSRFAITIRVILAESGFISGLLDNTTPPLADLQKTAINSRVGSPPLSRFSYRHHSPVNYRQHIHAIATSACWLLARDFLFRLRRFNAARRATCRRRLSIASRLLAMRLAEATLSPKKKACRRRAGKMFYINSRPPSFYVDFAFDYAALDK